eukprot:CAMPEP_0177661162 /NCGR_PEP_ID=MMETSP0447-20121125/18502_1 /TAXON_ID=0 /ORGANISM="Stygamoeba regulata, Strain BSH-02190019" /LENGTH=77 /DNA_ID=CAMNT_0019166427 /DNA_START=51 /DNA_END=284 /DNA_ORIENTATION=-
MGSKDKVTELQEAFYNFDTHRTGFISLEELRLIVTTDGEPMTDPKDVEDFINEARNFCDNSGNCDYRAFAACMLSDE